MRIEPVLVVIGVLLITVGSSPATGVDSSSVAAAEPDPPGGPAEDVLFAIEVGNRMFPAWKEEFRVGLGDSFWLGDTEFTAAPARFLPDFRIGDSGPFSASEARNNPALQMIVYQGSEAVDSTWAFQNFPPHYSARSFFTFRLLDVHEPGDEPGGESE